MGILSAYILGGTGFFLTWKARNNRRSTTPRMANRTTAETTVVVPRTPLPPAVATGPVTVHKLAPIHWLENDVKVTVSLPLVKGTELGGPSGLFDGSVKESVS